MIAKVARTTTTSTPTCLVVLRSTSLLPLTKQTLRAHNLRPHCSLLRRRWTRTRPEDDRYCALAPRIHKLVQETNVINREWGGQGAYAEGTVLKVAGISIVKTNHLPTTNRSAATGENNNYAANFTNNVGLVFNRQAVGTVKLMDLKMEQTGADVHALYQGTFMVGSMACGTGVLRLIAQLRSLSADRILKGPTGPFFIGDHHAQERF